VSDWLNRVHFGDCLETLRRMPDGMVQTCVTSPPYFGLRDYGHPGQIGLEASPEEFVTKLVEVFREVHRVLRDDGTLWLNLGDSYANDTKWGGATSGKHVQAIHGNTGIGRRRTSTGYKSKELMGIPWQAAFALSSDGWYLRQDIIWSKPNPMPESVRDRCTKAHEYIFLLSKSERYYFDNGAIQEPGVMEPGRAPRRGNSFARKVETGLPPGAPAHHREGREDIAYEGKRNKRSVWTVSTKPYSGAHFATFPEDLIEPCILAGAPAGGVVLDPFMGSGTTASVATRLGRQWIGCELNSEYEPLQRERLAGLTLGLALDSAEDAEPAAEEV
jgi:DNA modification methylase